jgi:hypothetical protein
MEGLSWTWGGADWPAAEEACPTVVPPGVPTAVAHPSAPLAQPTAKSLKTNTRQR